MASALLFALGVIGTVCKYMTIGPDVLGYVGSQVAENPYVSVAGDVGNSGMDGIELTRLMATRGVKVRLEDVRETEEVGHIAISLLTSERDDSRKLSLGRLYA